MEMIETLAEIETTVSVADAVRSFVERPAAENELPGAEHVDAIAACEQIIRAAEALQAEHAALLLREREGSLRGREAFLSAAGEAALARGMSPSAGLTQLETATGVQRMPDVLRLWREGEVSGATVRAVVRNLPPLGVDEIAVLEAELVPLLPGLTPRQAGELIRSLTIEIEPDAADRRAEEARADQYVLVVDERDGVATLIAHGPAEQVHEIADGLLREAGQAKRAGDPRSRGQVMFQALHAAAIAGPVPELDTTRVLELAVVVPLDTLFGVGDEPAELAGHGPAAPVVLDQLIDEADRVFYRRLITDPVDGHLVSMDRRRRLFTGSLARQIRYRDRRCRGPFCDAQIAEIDHIDDYQHGGETTEDNGQGICVTTHVIKHLPGWDVSRDGDTYTWRTPSGHLYRSEPPPIQRHRHR